MDSPQVLVVGAGPAGLVAGLTLARYGIKVMLIEKRERISTLSRALVISTRNMELFRSWCLEEAIREGAADVEPFGWKTPTLTSGDGEAFPLGYPSGGQSAAVSPTRPAWASQDHVEPLLLARLQASASAEVRMLTELIGLQQDDESVRVRLEDQRTKQTYEVDTQFVIGTDGAHSTVRSLLGIAMNGSDDLGEFHQVQFTAPLARVIRGTRYGLNIITHPNAIGVLAPRGCTDRWSFSREWRRGQPRLVDLSRAELASLIATASGVEHLAPRIERVAVFSFAAQIADSYRRGRSFLAGDAAHRMTPRGGTGMNTAIQDGYDLGWKLAWVLRGWATPDLLDSYETERRPIGLHNVTRSADTNGARQEPGEALPWDLNGRLAHRWLQRDCTRVSTLDLVGDGLTFLASAERPDVIHRAPLAQMRVPVVSHVVDRETAESLDIATDGAALFRPDGRRLVSWSGSAPLRPSSERDVVWQSLQSKREAASSLMAVTS